MTSKIKRILDILKPFKLHCTYIRTLCDETIFQIIYFCFRLLWTCFILSCGIYLIVTVVEEINNYYRYPTTMTQYTKPENEIEFPSVTVCNLNSLNKSAIKNDSRIDNYYFNISPFRGLANITTNWSDPIYEQEGFYLNRTLEDVMTDEKNIIDPGGFLVYATFHLSYLDVRKYFKVKLTYMGPCLTSNPDMKIKTNHVGSVFHLTLMLDLDSANNYYGSSYGEGLQVFVSCFFLIKTTLFI